MNKRNSFKPSIIQLLMLFVGAIPIFSAQAAPAYSLTFDSALSQYVSLPDVSDLKPASAITVELWYKSTDGNYTDLVSAGQPNADGWGYALTYNYGVGLSWQIGAGGTLHSVHYGFPLNYPPGVPTIGDGNWHQVVGTWDGTIQTLYFDGVSVGTPLTWSGSIGYNSSEPLIGATDFGGPGGYFKGSIDEVQIKNAAIDASTVTAHYDGGLGLFLTADANTMGLYHFDDGTSSTAADSSGLSHDGTLVNSPTWDTGKVPLTVNNPVPATTSISPTDAMRGAAELSLTVHGTNFIDGSVVKFNGNNKATVFDSATQLTATIPVGDLTTGGAFDVTVFTATPGGGTSNAQTFTVNAPPQVQIMDCGFSSELTEIAVGDVLCFQLNDPIYNVNPSAADVVYIQVASSTSDVETRQLTETGFDTGLFKSGITQGITSTDALVASGFDSPGVLLVVGGGTVLAKQIGEIPTVNGATQSGYWKLDEGTGTTTADSASTNTGTLVGTPTWGTGQFDYLNDHSLAFDGATQYVDVGTMGTYGSTFTQTSFEYWYKSSSTSAGAIIGEMESFGGQVFAIGHNFDQTGSPAVGMIVVNITDASAHGVVAANTVAISNLNDGNWHHVVVNANISTQAASIYFDGQPVSGGLTYGSGSPSSGLVNFTIPAYIGGLNINGVGLYYPFSGSIDNVIVSKNSISGAQALADYNAGHYSTEATSNIATVFGGGGIITGVVEPRVTISFSAEFCVLPELSIGSVKTCSVTVTTSTNALYGYSLYVKDRNNGSLISSVGSIPPVGESNTVVAGTAGYGISTDTAGQEVVHDATCANGASMPATPLSTSIKSFGHASVPVAYDATTICVAAGISKLTPAGTYRDVLIVTVVGNF